MPEPLRSREIQCADCRQTFSGKYASYCPRCRPKHRRAKAKKYLWTPERDAVLRNRYDSRVKGRAAEIAAALGWPGWVIKKRAQSLGLAAPAHRRDWTDEEEKFLFDHAGERSDQWIARKLGRSLTSVVMKFKHMKISRRVRSGYTLRELELCFGADHRAIERWVSDGKLRAHRRGTARTHTGDIWSFSDEAVLEFIQSCPMDFRLDRVDQFWFMDLILNSGLVKKALEAAREDAA